MVFKVLNLKQDKNFTIANFSILNRVSFCSGRVTLCPSSDPDPISPNNNTAVMKSRGARDFPLAIMNVAPVTFIGKQKKNRSRRNPWLIDSLLE